MTRASIAPSDAVAINAVLVASRQAVDAICDRWSLSLMLAALQGERLFSGLQAHTGMASGLLTARLGALESAGVLERARSTARLSGHEYRLTQAGEALAPVLLQMLRWDRNWAKAAEPVSQALRHSACGHPLRLDLRCAACGRPAGARDIELRVSATQLRRMPAKQTARRRSSLSGHAGGTTPQVLGPSLDVFGDKWGIEILLCAFFRIRRFSDFRASTGVSANILADRLARFVAAGVMTPALGGSRHAGYRLTEQGIDLYGAIVAIQDWADAWLPGRYRSPVQLIHRDCGAIYHPALSCAACERPMDLGDVETPAGARALAMPGEPP